MAEVAAVTPVEVERHPLWTYGCNDHVECGELGALPPSFSSTGFLRQDFPQVCKLLGVTPHPSFKVHIAPAARGGVGRRPSPAPGGRQAPVRKAGGGLQEGPDQSELAAYTAALNASGQPLLAVRNVLLDRTTMQVLALLLPTCTHLRTLCFSGCRLDPEMLALLQAGLREPCTVEALQIEWNPLELPLVGEDELQSPAAAVAEGVVSAAAAAVAAAAAAHGSQPEDLDPALASNGILQPSHVLDLRERTRARLQAVRTLAGFATWMADLAGGSMNATWDRLGGTPRDELLSAGGFHDVMEEALGATGSHVAEVFDILDGPDFAAGVGRTTLAVLKAALDAVPEETAPLPAGAAPGGDPIGGTWASLLEPACVAETVSLRACSVGLQEVACLATALSQSPWQVRCLNLWDNRICDRGVRLLARALKEYRGLEYIGLGHNRITDAGMRELCESFHRVPVDEEGRAAAAARIKEAEAQAETKAKAEAKAKAKVAPKVSPTPSGRARREPLPCMEEIEEQSGDGEGQEPLVYLRRPSALKTLVLSGNPIALPETLREVQPHGPRGADLLVKSTRAAAALLSEVHDIEGLEGGTPPALCPGSGGWILRAT